MVTVLGWIWIFLGALGTLSATLVVVFFVGMGPYMERAAIEQPGPELAGWAVLDWVFRHSEIVAIGQWVLTCTTLVAGIQLLRLRRWARAFLEAACWLGLAYTVGFGIWWGYAWVTLTDRGEWGPEAPPRELFTAFGAGMAAMMVLGYAVPAGAMIWALRHRTVRAAVAGGVDGG
jgi:hypothetical protein